MSVALVSAAAAQAHDAHNVSLLIDGNVFVSLAVANNSVQLRCEQAQFNLSFKDAIVDATIDKDCLFILLRNATLAILSTPRLNLLDSQSPNNFNNFNNKQTLALPFAAEKVKSVRINNSQRLLVVSAVHSPLAHLNCFVLSHSLEQLLPLVSLDSSISLKEEYHQERFIDAVSVDGETFFVSFNPSTRVSSIWSIKEEELIPAAESSGGKSSSASSRRTSSSSSFSSFSNNGSSSTSSNPFLVSGGVGGGGSLNSEQVSVSSVESWDPNPSLRFVAKCVWSEDDEDPSETISSVFSATDQDTTPVLVLLKSSHMSILRIDNSLTPHTLRLPCLSAVPVTQGIHTNILYLAPDNSLRLWTGQCLDIHITIPPSVLGIDPALNLFITHLSHGVGPRATLRYSNGIEYTVAFDFSIHCRVVADCVDALGYALPKSLHADFIKRLYEVRFRSRGTASFEARGDDWFDFVMVLCSFFVVNDGEDDSMNSKSLNQENESDWDYLVARASDLGFSDEHRQILGKESPKQNHLDGQLENCLEQANSLQSQFPTSKNSGFDKHLSAVLVALHLVGENLKLDIHGSNSKESCKLWHFLVHLAKYLGFSAYVDYYTEFGHVSQMALFKGSPPACISPTSRSIETCPPNILNWILRAIQSGETVPFLSLMDIPIEFGISTSSSSPPNSTSQPLLKQTSNITQIYTSLITQGPESAVETMQRVGFKALDLDLLSVGVSVPVKEALDYCRRFPKASWGRDVYLLIGRQDYAEQMSVGGGGVGVGIVTTNYDELSIPRPLKSGKREWKEGKDLTGVEIENNEIQSLRFRNDDRLEIVQKIMSRKQEPTLNAKVTAESTEEVIRTEQQSVLLSLSHKMLSLPLGRSLLTFETASPLLPERINFPHLTVSAKLPPLQESVHLDPTTTTPPDYYDWPNFHNGVAMGLRIPRDAAHAVTNSWILQNNPTTTTTTANAAGAAPAAAAAITGTPTCNHGGFLFALGLQGFLKTLEQWQAMVYLQPQHSVTSVGALLGIAASFKGTCDAFATRVLSLHVPRLMMSGGGAGGGSGGGGGLVGADVETDSGGGVGSVVQQFSSGGVAHSCAVVGLGLVYMGTGRRRYVEVLVDEIAGGLYDDSGDVGDAAGGAAVAAGSNSERFKNQEGHSVASGIALGLVMLGKGETAKNLEGVCLVEKLAGYLSGKRCRDSGKFQQQWQRQRQGRQEVSAAGAAIALGLIYLKSGNRVIAAKLDVPATRHLLDYVRSDLLMVRMLCRNLILWDQVKATDEWLEGQVPMYIREAVPRFELDDGSLESLKHARYHILAGSILALSIKFAGSCSLNALKLVRKYLDFFHLEATVPAITFREKLSKSIAKSCCDVVVLCLGVIMAGSGDVEILRLLNKYTDKVSADVSYGSHMALQMSLGFLFLGGGSGLTLGTSDEAVAALVCSLYPRFPMAADDNCCHLQALRHMWVLAVDRTRILISRDVESREACLVPVVVCFKGGRIGVQEMVLHTPCILPPLSTVEFIALKSERYLAMKLDIGSNESHLKSLLDGHTLFVKRKTGHLDYIKDPKGQMGILSRSFPLPKITAQPLDTRKRRRAGMTQDSSNELEEQEFMDFILTSFSQDPRVLAFAQELCDARSSKSSLVADFGGSRFCLRALRECLVEDKVDAVVIYFELYMIVKNALERLDSVGLYNLKIVDAFYNSMAGFRSQWMFEKPRLLNELFCGSVQCQLVYLFETLQTTAPFVVNKEKGVGGGTQETLLTAPEPNFTEFYENWSSRGQAVLSLLAQRKGFNSSSLAQLSDDELRLVTAFITYKKLVRDGNNGDSGGFASKVEEAQRIVSLSNDELAEVILKDLLLKRM